MSDFSALTKTTSKKPIQYDLNDFCDTESALEGVSGSMAFIRLNKSKFAILEGGEKTTITQDGHPVSAIAGIIVGVKSGLPARAFYKGVYNSKESTAPDCASLDGIKPDSTIKCPQASTCEECPRNAWGSATGSKGKECKSRRRLVFCVGDENDEKLENYHLYRLDLPTMSIKPFAVYAKTLKDTYKTPLIAVVTVVSFDPEVATQYDKLTFKPLRHLTEEEIATIRTIRDSKVVKEMLESTAFVEDEEAKAQKPKTKKSPINETISEETDLDLEGIEDELDSVLADSNLE